MALGGCAPLNTSGLPRTRRPRPRSFVVYYGRGPIAGIERFELALLEPLGWTEPELTRLRAQGVTTLAYVSALEASDAIYREAGLTPGDLLPRAGRPWYKAEWGTWVADPRSARWRAHLRAHVTSLMRGGWHGVFLDTLGDVEDDGLAGQSAWLLPAAADLLQMVRRAVGSGQLMQNHGLQLLLPLVASQLDGICWESPPLEAFGHQDWADQTLERVLSASLRYDLALLLLGRAPAAGAGGVSALAEFAMRQGALAYTAPDNYHLGIRLPDGRVQLPGSQRPQ